MALVLTRRVREGVTVTVPASETTTIVHIQSVDVKGQQTKLAITAPKDAKILRDELIEQDKQAKYGQ